MRLGPEAGRPDRALRKAASGFSLPQRHDCTPARPQWYLSGLAVRAERRKAIELALQSVAVHRFLALEVAGFVEAVAERGGRGASTQVPELGVRGLSSGTNGSDVGLLLLGHV
jgi:hypothetical protein